MSGSVEFVGEKELDRARGHYDEFHPEARGIDRLRDEDQFGRLCINKVTSKGVRKCEKCVE